MTITLFLQYLERGPDLFSVKEKTVFIFCSKTYYIYRIYEHYIYTITASELVNV